MSIILEKTGMRVIPALISFVMLIIFVVPFFHGIVNLGNCAGAAVTSVLLAVFVFFRKFSEIVASLWSTPVGKALVTGVSVVAAVGVILAAVITVLMISAAHDYPKDTNTTVVVLGCQVKNGRPSKMLNRRINAAYEYLAENPEVIAIVSGGKGDDELISEALCMRDCLVEKGISPERIIMEDKSASTRENLEFSKKIIEQRGLDEHITIVTDSYHQLRAEMIAGELGMTASNISAPTAAWLIPTYWVREWFGTVHQFLFG